MAKKKDPDIYQLVQYLQVQFDDIIPDAIKFDKGNATAGVRVRLRLQEISHAIRSLRLEILTRKKKREEIKNKGK